MTCVVLQSTSGRSISQALDAVAACDFGAAFCAFSFWIEYQMTPVRAKQIPKNFFMDIESPKRRTPIVRIDTVFKWPTMLYVNGEVAPIIKKVDSDTNIPRQPLMMMVMTASVVHDSLYQALYESNPNSLFSGSCMSIGVQQASITTTWNGM